MIDNWLIISTSAVYLVLLFAIAIWAERNKQLKWLSGPYVYALSLAVYCTAWTFYGSVGRAANHGLEFLTTYIGPVLLAPVFWLLLRKMIRIAKVQRITTLADFLAARYNKSSLVGSLVAILCILAVIPYMSIQLKAITESYQTLAGLNGEKTGSFFADTSLYIAMVLGVFTILFSTPKVDANQRNTGLVAAIAFESLFKLAAFVLVGLYVTFGLFNGFGDIFRQASQSTDFDALMRIADANGSYESWFWLNSLSMCAIVLLPRQFHIGVKENTDENHLKKASWLFPLYLLLINLFVVPVALGGKLLFTTEAINADTYVIALPLANGNALIALIVYLGGFAAATSMIIVTTSALSIMLSNSLLTPLLLSNRSLQRLTGSRLNVYVLRGRQLMVLVMLLLAFAYYKYVGNSYSLVSIGLISFVGVAQLMPALLGALYWKQGSRMGAIISIAGGGLLWLYLLVLPTTAAAGLLNLEAFFISFGIPEWLQAPLASEFGSNSFIVKGFMWCILPNGLLYVVASACSRQSPQEVNQAEIFVDIFNYSTVYESIVLWKGQALKSDLKKLLYPFLGKPRTDRAFSNFSSRNNIAESEIQADARLVGFTEKLLSGAVGSASSRVMMRTVVKEESVDLQEVLSMLKETQRFISDNRELTRKSHELEVAGKKLQRANQQLTLVDKRKDEFISTVTHEMRTPLTSIRALTEILQSTDDIETDEKEMFLDTIVAETKRMDRLINQVLDLEKMRSGKMRFELHELDLNDVISQAVSAIEQVAKERTIELSSHLSATPLRVKGNFDRLTQVVLNLLSNALKFSEGKVSISSRSVKNLAEVVVSDNGRGISEQNIERIFQPFFQADNQTLKKPEGTGLGLSISKSIIDYHKGTIGVDKHDKETRIRFRIPKCKTE